MVKSQRSLCEKGSLVQFHMWESDWCYKEQETVATSVNFLLDSNTWLPHRFYRDSWTFWTLTDFLSEVFPD